MALICISLMMFMEEPGGLQSMGSLRVGHSSHLVVSEVMSPVSNLFLLLLQIFLLLSYKKLSFVSHNLQLYILLINGYF